MAFDFSNVVNTASDVVAKAAETERVNYPYPLVYPTPGQTLLVKLLYNPASKSVVRLVHRHEKIPCYRSYGIECPICKYQEQVVSTLGQDPFGKTKSKSRGISFAKLVSCTKPIEYTQNNTKKKINPGDTVLLMYPWSVYQEINRLINLVASTPSGMEQAFCYADTGLFIQITVTEDYKYSATNAPFQSFQTGLTNQQFMDFLEEMPSLADQVIPATIDEKVDAQVKEYADNIYREFIAPRVPTQNVTDTAPTNLGNGIPNAVPASAYVPPTVNVPPTTNPNQYTGVNYATQIPTQPTVQAPTKPNCFGSYTENQPKCICCPHEVECSALKASYDPELPFN